MSDMSVERVSINGVEYVKADCIKPAAIPGKRAVVVVDRGWIFAGDVTRKDGRVLLTRCVWVFSWNKVGFDGMIANPKSVGVTIRSMPGGATDIPEASEIFCVPVSDDWGL